MSGGQLITFLVDTRAQHPVLTRSPGPLNHRTAWVQGATGRKQYPWTTERKVNLATGKVSHSFLHVPDCPYPLLKRELLTKLKAQIHFEGAKVKVSGPRGAPLQILTLSLEDEFRLHKLPPPQKKNSRGHRLLAQKISIGLDRHRKHGTGYSTATLGHTIKGYSNTNCCQTIPNVQRSSPRYQTSYKKTLRPRDTDFLQVPLEYSPPTRKEALYGRLPPSPGPP